MNETIDLTPFQTEGAWVFSGRPRGQKIRQELEIDKIDTKPTPVKVIIPNEIIGLNPSFFLGLFGPSVRKFGADKFRIKYPFTCNSAVITDIEEGITQALKESNPLQK